MKFKARGGLSYGSYLGEPLGLAILDDGNVLVSDSEKSCVHIYDENGKYQGKFGDSDLHLRQPAGTLLFGGSWRRESTGVASLLVVGSYM